MIPFIYFLLLLYFWYFYLSESKIDYAAPLSLHTLPIPPLPQFVPFADRIEFRDTQGHLLWSEPLPDSLHFHGQKLVYKDACGSIADGIWIEATGRPLYDYAKKYGFPSSGTSHYFVCRGGRIEALHTCPAGQVFTKGKCLTPHACVGQPDGTVFGKKGDLYEYVECQDDQPISKTCPKNTYFHTNSCLSKRDVFHYCKFFDSVLLLSPTRRLECVGGKPVFHECPDGYAFLGGDHCESLTCVGKPNNSRIGLPDIKTGPLAYSPGYQVCQNEKVVKTTYCDFKWHPDKSKEDDLLHLPMVFDGKECAIPQFCTNVRADSEMIVPGRDFAKHATNWKDAKLFDSLSGHRCENGIRVPWTAPPGKRIVEYRESDGKGKVPIYQEPKKYFDSATGQVETCASDEQFNGHECVKLLDDAFSYRGLQLFEFSNLEHHWIKGWGWTKETFTPTCDSSHKYLGHYNLCIHADCINYPFLKQIPNFQILLQGKKAKCVIQPGNVLTTTPVDFEYDFWTQRKDVAETNRCRKGKIQTGHFVWDSSVHATCHSKQPFVFCPVETTIEYHRHLNRHACVKNVTDTVEFQGPRNFIRNEILHIENKSSVPMTITTEEVHANGQVTTEDYQVNPGTSSSMRPDLALKLPAGSKLFLTYRYRPTYPPDVAYENGIPVGTVHNTDKGLCIYQSTKEAKFSRRSQNYAMHEVNAAVKEFLE